MPKKSVSKEKSTKTTKVSEKAKDKKVSAKNEKNKNKETIKIEDSNIDASNESENLVELNDNKDLLKNDELSDIEKSSDDSDKEDSNKEDSNKEEKNSEEDKDLEKEDKDLEKEEKEEIDFKDIEFADHVHKIVKEIKFGFLSPQLIKKMATVKVVTPELYDREGYPVDGGLMDVRMGVIDPGLKCPIDGKKLKECPGYFGYVELARPVIHIGFVAQIYAFLRGTCKECGRTLFTTQKINKILKDIQEIESKEGIEGKRKYIKEILKTITTSAAKVCPHCKTKQGKVSLEKPTTFMEDDRRISAIEIRTRLEKVLDEECVIFGLNYESIRPEWMILTIMAIPPVTMRPSITLESGERSEDDLTHKLGDIVRINQRLFENINAGAPEIIIEDLWDLLQYHITTFFDNNVAQLPPARHRSGQPLKTLTERIKSKGGRIRNNLAGKRTNYSARTVISPDPMIQINEVGVPKFVAMNITVPETITSWNIDYVKKFLENGPKIYPGANYLVRPDGKKKKITEETKEALLSEIGEGYAVERHLMDGDVAIFNRQPSLHRMSMMCHKIRVLPYKTFRINPTVSHPYNADFDGDEMNLHVPQTEEARAEAETLMEVQTQIISPGFGLSVIGLIQDSIVGNYILTREKSYPREEVVDMLFSIGISDFSGLPNKKELSGKEIFSFVLPEGFNFVGNSKGPDENGNHEVVIKNGQLEKGVMDGSNLGHGAGLMFRNIHKRYGAKRTIVVLGNIFRLGIAVLLKEGFTVSLSDMDLSDEAAQKIEEIVKFSSDQAVELVKSFNDGTLEEFPGRTMLETLELSILEALNKARNNAGKIVLENVDKESHLYKMIISGARGSMIQLGQMTACVGQQAMRGKRIEKGYADRTLPHFKKGDLGPEAHGFIQNSFRKGLKPSEFFFTAMTGRDSLMDTALRTPKSGYLYRRLANAMQDLKVEYDNTVRDAGKHIIQFDYGEDGVDVSKSEGGIINVKRIVDTTK